MPTLCRLLFSRRHTKGEGPEAEGPVFCGALGRLPMLGGGLRQGSATLTEVRPTTTPLCPTSGRMSCPT